ncbi:MAG: hypothetical protein MRZ39_07625 [Oscillospiraceae bacterium]|nr:hypothetical protein [Oscillospiraceae bacterium]
MMTKHIKNILPAALTVLTVMLMTAAAEFSGEKEILFPEIAAIAAGALIAPKFAWKTSKLRLFVLICIGSVLGLLISMFVPLALSVKLCIAFLAASLLFQFSGTTFAPVISSVVLPVMLGTNSVIYPIAAAVLTFLILMERMLTEKLGIAEKSEFSPEPMPDKNALVRLAARWLIGSIAIVLAVGTGFGFAVAPPLLVAFTEFCRKDSAVRKKPVAITLLIAGCALVGAVCRSVFTLLGWKMFAAAGVTMLIVCIIMKSAKLFVPPAAALSVLAFLIPEEAVITYPLQIAAGTVIFVLVGRIFGKMKSEQVQL